MQADTNIEAARWGMPEQIAITKAITDCLLAATACDSDSLANALIALGESIEDKPEVIVEGQPTRAQLIQAARDTYGNDDINIDGDACLSESPDEAGSWVQAWVWISYEEALEDYTNA